MEKRHRVRILNNFKNLNSHPFCFELFGAECQQIRRKNEGGFRIQRCQIYFGVIYKESFARHKWERKKHARFTAKKQGVKDFKQMIKINDLNHNLNKKKF